MFTIYRPNQTSNGGDPQSTWNSVRRSCFRLAHISTKDFRDRDPPRVVLMGITSPLPSDVNVLWKFIVANSPVHDEEIGVVYRRSVERGTPLADKESVTHTDPVGWIQSM